MCFDDTSPYKCISWATVKQGSVEAPEFCILQE